jgi:hypothetical protein
MAQCKSLLRLRQLSSHVSVSGSSVSPLSEMLSYVPPESKLF